MVTAVNHVYEHGGHAYHLQAEDLGVERGAFEVRVYDGGCVLWHKRVPYGEMLEQGLPKMEFETALHTLMEKTLHTVQAAIAKGKLA